MVTPHPVGAPYPIQLFSHPPYVFGRRNASLPKLTLLFLRRQSFHSKYVHICYAPTSRIHVYKEQKVYICRSFLRTLFKTSHVPGLQVIPRQCGIHDTHFLHWQYPALFDFVFVFRGFSWCIEKLLLCFLATLKVNLLDFFSRLFPM